jgi:hypothetical protein
MKKLLKSTEVTSIQSVTNGACYCTATCGSAPNNVRLNYERIMMNTSSTGTGPMSYSENE